MFEIQSAECIDYGWAVIHDVSFCVHTNVKTTVVKVLQNSLNLRTNLLVGKFFSIYNVFFYLINIHPEVYCLQFFNKKFLFW